MGSIWQCAVLLFMSCFSCKVWGFSRNGPLLRLRSLGDIGIMSCPSGLFTSVRSHKYTHTNGERRAGGGMHPKFTWRLVLDDDQSFSTWASKHGVRAPKVKIGYTEGLRGLVLTEDIVPPHSVVVLPRESSLYSFESQPCPFPDWVSSRSWSDAALGMKLAMLLIHEKRLGSGSRFAPWIAVMPPTHEDKPCTWTLAQVDELQDEDLKEKIVKQNSTVHRFYDALQKNNPDNDITREEWSWAMNTVFSRGILGNMPQWQRGGKLRPLIAQALMMKLKQKFPPFRALLKVLPAGLRRMADGVALSKEILYMPPFIDMINHRTGVRANHVYDKKQDAWTIVSYQAWSKGQDIRIDYQGERSHARTLLMYGFIENDANEYLVVSLPRDTFLNAAREVFLRLSTDKTNQEWDMRLQAAEASGLLTGSASFEITSRGPSPTCTAFLEFLMQGSRDHDLVREFVRQTGLSACETDLRLCATTLEDDKVLMQDASKTRSVAFDLALRYRMRRKQLLVEALEALWKDGEAAAR